VDEQRVLGVDACRGGWIGIALHGERIEGYVAADIEQLVRATAADGQVTVVAIDIPIGLPDHGVRKADELARDAVGPLWASVFMTPVRAALGAETHADAVRINRDQTGRGVSAQAYALRRKLFEVEQWIRRKPVLNPRVIEVHPEVSFAQLAGAPLTARKSSWAGVQRRRELLTAAGIALSGGLGPAGRVAGVDDVLDAGVAAWTARRFAAGAARSLPDPPEVLVDGTRCAIWV